MTQIQALLIDIEGTTSSLSVLKDQLAPYARAHLPDYLHAQRELPAVRAAVQATRELAGEAEASEARVLEILLDWIDRDRKAPPLKVLQGLVWEIGYRDGSLRGHLFPDVVPALRALRAAGLKLYIYSSGSVLAQQLFFAYSVEGDVRDLFDGHFDTSSGAKQDPAAYRSIACSLGLPTEAILFLSDAQAELDAAKQAGMEAIGVAREGNPPVHDHRVVAHFGQLELAGESSLPSGEGRASTLPARAGALRALIELASYCDRRGHVRATSGNFSLRLGHAQVAITVSGRSKGALREADFVTVDLQGRVLASGARPSAETALHCALYRARAEVHAVAHTHSVAATVLSRRHVAHGVLTFTGFEMQKAFAGVSTHESELSIPIVPNAQDMAALVAAVDRALEAFPGAPAYLVAGHGLTTWGSDVEEVRRNLEALEFLFDCALAESAWSRSPASD